MEHMQSKLNSTAPERIWLQVSQDARDHKKPFPEANQNMTWCDSSVLACEVEYVRSDLVRAALPVNANDPDDPELFKLAALLGMTANT